MGEQQQFIFSRRVGGPGVQKRVLGEYTITSGKKYDGLRLFEELCKALPGMISLDLERRRVSVSTRNPYNKVDRSRIRRVMRLHKAGAVGD